MRRKKPLGSKGSAGVNKLMRRLRVKKIARLVRTNRPAGIAILVGVIATAMLFAAAQSSKPGRANSTPGSAKHVTAPRDVKLATRTAAAAPSSQPRTEPTAGQSTEPTAEASAPVTITGCLERADQTFRLKDTAGADAPRSRSWKTAFLKKGSPSIEVVDASNRLKMDNYVGQRVSLTGTLVDREMHARWLQRVAPSCESSKTAKSEAL